MKKLIAYTMLALVACIVAMPALAETCSRVYTINNVGAGTNTAAYNINGQLEGIYIDHTTASTGLVAVTTAYDTLLTVAASSADAMYYPRINIDDVAGNTNVAYATAPMAGLVTVSVTANAPSGTNNYTVTILYSK